MPMQDQPLLQESQDQLQTVKILVSGVVTDGGGGAHVDVSLLALHKTNWPNFDAKFLVCATNIHRGKIYDG